MIKISLYIFLLFYHFSLDSIEIRTIVENCKSCHGYEYQGNEYIESLINLEKSVFISKMKEYKEINNANIMSRISSALSESDIKKIADLIYEDREK